MRNVVVALVVVIVAVVVWWQWPRHHDGQPGIEAQRAAATAPVTASTPSSSVRRLDPEARKRLGQQIETAIKQSTAAKAAAQTASSGGSAAPTLDGDPVIPLEQVGKPLQEGLQASIPLLAACYEKSGTPPKTAAASMTMASDPDLGTVIDTATMTDASGQPLAKELDECLRDVVDSLALPPLGRPGKLQIQYTFKFD